jgi:hypothetical protein
MLYGVGLSLTASACVLFVSSWAAARDNRVAKLIDEWGVEAMYETRQAMNGASDEQLGFASGRLDIMGWGLKSLRHAQSDLIKQRIQAGLKVRILVPNPKSPYVSQRDAEEDRNQGTTAHDIDGLKLWVDDIRQQKTGNGDIELRFYDSTPQHFYFRVDNSLFIGPYWYGKESQQTISYEFRTGRTFKLYTDYFETLWNDTKFCSEQPQS